MPGIAARNAPGAWAATATSGVKMSGSAASEQKHARCAERDQRPEGDERPSRNERACDADQRRNRLARADLRPAMLVIAERSEVSVIARPVERVAERRDYAQSGESGTDPVHLGEQRILQRRENGAGDDERPHAGLDRDRNDDGPNDEPAGENRARATRAPEAWRRRP